MGYDMTFDGNVTIPEDRQEATRNALAAALGLDRDQDIPALLCHAFGSSACTDWAKTQYTRTYSLSGEVRVNDAINRALKALAGLAVVRIECQGEDGEMWVHSVAADGQVREIRALVTYPGEKGLSYNVDDLRPI